MSIFFTIIFKLIPLYFLIVLGYIAAKKLNVQKETIAKLLIYIIAPTVIFYGAYTTKINFANLSLPLLFMTISSVMSLLFLKIGGFVYKKESTKNILALAAGTGNTGYFGLPVVFAILGEEAFSLAVLSILGFILFENTLGFYITAKGNHSAKESLMKVLKLPIIYAFSLGLFFNLLSIDLGQNVLSIIDVFKGAYTLLGMMMIGMGVAIVDIKQVDYKYIMLSFSAKFIFWPLIIFGIIFLDKTFFNYYNQLIYNVLIVMAIVPLAANTVAYATELKVHPEKAALAVLLSTIFALFFIPLMTSLFIS